MAGARPRPGAEVDQVYLPDLCQPRTVLAVVLIAELLAIVLALARQGVTEQFWVDLASSSLFLLWVALSCAWVLCSARPRLAARSSLEVTAVAFALIIATTLLMSEATYWLGRYTLGDIALTSDSVFPTQHLDFVLRNLGIAGIVSALVLRYFYVSHQWRRNVEMEARSRVRALQARIRPHFLFNSMNTIAALTRSNPETAEQAVEDLADLFRASLSETKQQIHMKEEFEMARIYQRIEQLRLGERLRVDWQVRELPMRALIPPLTVQPLLENAIYHGIEPLPEGGTVLVEGERDDDMIYIRISNPVPHGGSSQHKHDGNQMALSNIRQRLELAHGERGTVEIEAGDARYRVTLAFPFRESLV